MQITHKFLDRATGGQYLVHMINSSRQFIVSRTGTIVSVREVEPGSCDFTLTREEAWEQARSRALPAKASQDPKRRFPAAIEFIGLDGMTTIVQTREATQQLWEGIAQPAEPVVVEATDEDERLLRVVDALRNQRPNDFRDSLLAQYERKGTLSEKQIAAVEKGIRAYEAAKAAGPIPEVPAGRYAIVDENDVAKFYTVQRPTEGKWAGYTFLNVLASDAEHPIKGAARNAILAKIAADPKAASILYGQRSSRCGVCNRLLTDDSEGGSIEKGIGPICEEKMGW